MKPRLWTIYQLLLLYTLDFTNGHLGSRDVASSAEGIELAKEVSEPSSSQAPNKPVVDGVGTKDAPFDGKDGRPHLGPFVETSAERDRKKAKESGDEVSTKTPAKDATKGSTGDAVPASNDGVMDDPNRRGPKEGTRGTEGGITEKTKDGKEDKKDTPEKKPDPPKEAPPLPQSEQKTLEKQTGKEDDKKPKEGTTPDPDKKKDEGKKDDKGKGIGGLEKPADLPKKPHDIPPPTPPTSKKNDPLAILKPYTDALPSFSVPTSASIIQPLHSFVLSLTMILFSEIGDKTFLIAALMAMKHPRFVVYSAALTALIAMTILSAVLGHAVPQLIPKRLVNYAAAALFLIFGAKMLREGFAMRPDQGVSEEMREVEMELAEKEELARKMGRRRSSISPYMIEAGRIDSRKTRSSTRLPAPPDSPPSPDSRSPSPSSQSSVSGFLVGINNLLSLLLSPAWVQTFIMTFLGEWGDRSQISTIAMAAGQEYWWVTGGAIVGHGICTAVAVVGGRAIAGKVSLRMVTLGGGGAFVVFGIIYLFEAMYT
ncbi:uncharacterized protein KY384_000956 [Bacidia gigantensis]|uniref:uncharacterized protein n=1 Tax=Bacidia gigantensis TaxID=2732470 RepID=UPI001D03A5C4|nr:uncharacterized protein KY384_000956 [Bacidia gigantensis]KAG8534112.1 hypothetical protein KY384_000956 [Bacidia gigantensis]